MGPLALSATCSQSAGKTVAVLRARSGADGVVVRGQALAAGDSVAVQTVEFSPGVPFEAFTAFSATDASQSFAIQGVPVVMVNTLGKDCRFIGTLIEVAPR
jgi:hypothetical protein